MEADPLFIHKREKMYNRERQKKERGMISGRTKTYRGVRKASEEKEEKGRGEQMMKASKSLDHRE